MKRLLELTPEEMSVDQRRVADAICGGPRGSLDGPFMAWLQSPQMADRAQWLGEFLRFGTALPARLSELAILLVARHWTSQFEWRAHAQMALNAGVPPDVIEAIREQRLPALRADETTVVDFVSQLLVHHHVSDEVFAQAVALFERRGVVELVGIAGYYTLVAMTLNAFEVPIPEGENSPVRLR
jgi:4-carboxymuconolactone decarboxylase